MAVNAVVLLRTEESVRAEDLATLRKHILLDLNLTGEEDFYAGEIMLPITVEDMQGPVVAFPGNWYKLGLLHRYFGPGYEQGTFPIFVGIAEWLENQLPSCEIWYGSNGRDDEDFVRFDAERRRSLLERYREVFGHLGYFPQIQTGGPRHLAGGPRDTQSGSGTEQ